MSRAWLIVLFVTYGVTDSRADAPPPPGYVERCEVEKVQKKGEFCTSCPAWHGDHDACSRQFRAERESSWALRCKTRGASVWSEIWCMPWTSTTGKPPLPKPVPKP